MLTAEDYTVRLDAFQGPLDLLLYLIRRAEVDIHDIPISKLTEQYLAFLKNLNRIDIDAAGEFLVMAATLMEIKSRMLTPPVTSANGSDQGDGSATDSLTGESSVPGLDQADPRYELVVQLLAYKQYRDAASELEHRRGEWQQRFPVRASVPTPSRTTDVEPTASAESVDDAEDESTADVPAPELEDVSVWDLARLFQQVVSAVDFARLGDHRVEYDDTPIELHQEDLLDQLTRSAERSLSFRSLMSGRTRVEAIGLFLATLELVRNRRVSLQQDRPNDDIVLALNDDASDDESDADPG